MKAIVGLLALAACQRPAPPDLPWLHGLRVIVSSTGIAAPGAPDEEPPDGCGTTSMRLIELTGDVAPAPGRETIAGSYATGLVMFDRQDRVLAETGGYPCTGSADELDVIAVGSAYTTPMLALAATTGGRRETSRFVGLFRLPSLDPMFAGVVETRDGERIQRGSIHLFPGGLVYTRPGGAPKLWRLDPAGVYLPMLPDLPHDEPRDLPVSIPVALR